MNKRDTRIFLINMYTYYRLHDSTNSYTVAKAISDIVIYRNKSLLEKQLLNYLKLQNTDENIITIINNKLV